MKIGEAYLEKEKSPSDPLEVGDSLENSRQLGGFFYTILAMNEKVAIVRLKAWGLARNNSDNGMNEEFSLEFLQKRQRVTAEKVRNIY